MAYHFFILALLFAALDWFAAWRGLRPLEWLAKPAVMLALLGWMIQNGGLTAPLLPFVIGLLFSLAGDVFLMLPKEQFIAGLVSFLLAHLAYLVGFNAVLPPVNAISLTLAVLVGITASQLYRRIVSGLQASGKLKLKPAVMIYSGVISLMLLSALMTLLRSDWEAGPALACALGATLFFVSDSFLAWNKFVAPLSYGKLRVHSTYHLGQILIILGAMLHYLPG